ncbi:MAG: acyl carrier protein [Chloroflexota bacterium]
MEAQAKLKQFIEDELLIGRDVDLEYDDNLLISGLVNSLAIMRLVSFAEELYEVEIPAEEITIENFISISAMNTYLQTLKN